MNELIEDVLPAMIDRRDQFLFYWSGHSVQHKNVGYLPLASSRNDDYSTMISMRDISVWTTRDIAARQALFLFDTCLGGLPGTVRQSGERNLPDKDQLAKRAIQLVSACTANEEPMIADRWGGSIFTNSVLRHSRGSRRPDGPHTRDGVVATSELVGYVEARMDREKRDAGLTRAITPQFRALHTNGGEFIFVTSDIKIAKLQSQGRQYEGRFEYGTPVSTYRPTAPPPPTV